MRLPWYVSELIKWKFRAFDSAYGIEIKDVQNEKGEDIGDYDVLAILGNLSLLYIECKSGGFNGKHIEKVINRSRTLHCIASVIFFGQVCGEDEIKERLGRVHHRERFGLIDQNQFHTVKDYGIDQGEIYVWNDCYFVNGSSMVNVEAKLRTALRAISASSPENQRSFRRDYKELGFQHNSIQLGG